MPRKAKEEINVNEIIDEKKTTKKASTRKKKVDEVKPAAEEKAAVKKTTTRKKAATKEADEVESAVKKTTTRKKATTKKADEAKSSEEKTAVKKTSAKKKTSTKKADEVDSSEKKATVKKTSTRKKSTDKKSAEDIPLSDEKAVSGKDVEKKATSKAKTTKATKTASEKKTTTSRKTTATSKKNTATSKKSSASTTNSKKATTTSRKKTSTTSSKKSSTKKVATQQELPVQIAEYYDLPYKYGNTIVRLLAQTPKTLFIYWEVSDLDIANFKAQYGENFFNITKPVILVHNLTLNKSYEVEINDFANCWYLNTEDSNCKFDIELARKFIDAPSVAEEQQSEYVHVATSNNIQSPNDHIMFEKLKEFVIFRNVSNDNVIKKSIKSFKFLKDIYKFYKDMYDDEILKNPSSQFKF